MHSSIAAFWRIIHTDNITGEVLYESEDKNVVVDNGRALNAYDVFGLGASATVIALGAGACSTAAVHTDSHLNYEHILNATRKTLTNTSGAALTTPDVVSTSFTDSFSEPYYRKITVQSVFNGASDGNVNQPFQEFGLFTTTVLPGTPSGTSGTMYNHFVANSAVILTSTTTLTVQCTIYY